MIARLVVALACVAGTHSVLACNADAVTTFERTSIKDGTTTRSRFELRVPVEVLRQSPLWKPGAGAVPLSLEDAISRTKDWVSSLDANAPELRVKAISLRGCTGEDGFRFYLVDLAAHGLIAIPFRGAVIRQKRLE